MHKRHLKNLIILVSFIFLTISIFIQSSLYATEKASPQILKEVENWKFYPNEEATETFFPCGLIECKKFNNDIKDGVFKFYFNDGFVLTFATDARLLEAYYVVSPQQNSKNFILNCQNISSGKVNLSKNTAIRIELMKNYAFERFEFTSAQDINALGSFFQDEISSKLFRGFFDKVIEYTNKVFSLLDKFKVENLETQKSIYLALRAFAYKAKGQKLDFLADAKQAYQNAKDKIWPAVAFSVVCIEEKNYEEAINILSKLEQTQFVLLLEAIAYANFGQLDKAISIYKNLSKDFITTDSKFFQLYFDDFYSLIGDYKEKILTLAKENKKNAKIKEALNYYIEYMNLANKEEEIDKVIGEVLVLMKQYPDLFQLNDDALKLVARAKVYISQRNFIEAIREYQNALRLFPFTSSLYKELAMIYAQLKQYNLAVKYMKIFLKLNPEDKNYTSLKEQIYQWEFLMELENKKEK
ncbi:MAG: hypothetical protein QXZ20_03055 [Candidatus Aenigmatarchaeota archaeon]